MAPEQLLGRHVDARSDQFSFCVALHAAITGSHPFDGDTIEELLSSLLEGRRRRPARTMRIPRGLERAIERGLSADPDDRHPSMPALLESLRRSGARRRDTLLAPWIAGCALIAGGALALHGIDCSAAVGGARHLPAALEGAPPVPDAYEREWIAQHTSACESPGARCPIQATNLLREAGFDRRGYVWRPRPAPSSVRLNWVDGHLRIDAAAADASIVQEVPWIVPPGRSYQLTVRVRASDGAAPVRGRLVLSGMGLGGQSHSSTPFLARADWSQVSVTFSPKAHYDRVRAELALAAPGSIDIDGAELIDAGLIDASFEDASAVHRSTAWRPYNDQESVRTRWLATDAFDGLRAVEVRTARSGGSLAQDTTRMPLVGTTYTFVAWLRAGEGVPSVPGNLALWALGDGEERKVVKTGFDVGRSWTRVQASLDIEKYGYVALRAEVYVRADAPLEIDAARLIPAGLVDASFEAGSSAWYVLADSTATARRVVDPATPGPGGRTSLAKDGWHWLRLRSADARGSVAQNVPDPLGGTTYTFSAWLRAVPGSAAPVSGHLVIGALGGTSEESLTPFRIGAEWTLVTATLQVESDDHTALRVAVSLHGSGTEIDIDGTCLTGANPLLPSTP